jgi:hypothetical protein
VKRIAERTLIGGVDQFSDSTDLIGSPVGLAALYR